jgi:dTDP-4-amino-4,6-dideoxygalactose transaminase
MNLPPIVFSRPYHSADELSNLAAVLESGHVHGDGVFTSAATEKLRGITGVPNILLTTSGSHALELASLLLELGPGDEVILPSFTFPSAANAVALTGAQIVFVDVEPLTGNIDPALVRKHITSKTKAVSVVHYGGVAADLEALQQIASEHGLAIIEDNAHGLGGEWRGRQLGTFGQLAIQSFHDTKNVQSGEGGALLVNDPALMERAEMIREKGTNRSRYLRGQVDKYTWTDIGSSYLPSELNAAVLDSQLAEFDTIQSLRHRVWDAYATQLAGWAAEHSVFAMTVPDDRKHTAHLFFLLMPTHALQGALIAHLKTLGVLAGFHYVPLDSSVAGLRYGRTPEPCLVSEDFSTRLVRLPLWAGMTDADVQRVIDGVTSFRVAG